MNGLETLPRDAPGILLHGEIERWCARTGLSVRAFGALALGDPNFVVALGRGRSPRLSTIDRVLVYMGEAPAGSFFRAEVEAFLSVTEMKRSVLGVVATGNPSFVAQLRRGLSPRLSTVGRVRAWMAAQANPAQRREIGERAGAAPAFLDGVPACARLAPPGIAAGPGTGIEQREPEAAIRGCGAYVSTAEAAALLGLSPRTLDRYRMTGAGPAFHRFGGCVRYRLDDLDSWAASGS